MQWMACVFSVSLFDMKTICGTSRAHLLFLDALFLFIHSHSAFHGRIYFSVSFYVAYFRAFFINRAENLAVGYRLTECMNEWMNEWTKWMIYYPVFQSAKQSGNAKCRRLIGLRSLGWMSKQKKLLLADRLEAKDNNEKNIIIRRFVKTLELRSAIIYYQFQNV